MKSPYDEKTEQLMLKFYQSLNERERRRYAAVEATKLGWGGQSYISELLSISRLVIRRGQWELEASKGSKVLPVDRQRRKGGGRKKKSSSF